MSTSTAAPGSSISAPEQLYPSDKKQPIAHKKKKKPAPVKKPSRVLGKF